MLAVFLGNFSHQSGTTAVFVGTAVGKVEPGDVHTSGDQFGNFFRAAGCWSQGGDDFGAAQRHAQVLVC